MNPKEMALITIDQWDTANDPLRLYFFGHWLLDEKWELETDWCNVALTLKNHLVYFFSGLTYKGDRYYDYKVYSELQALLDDPYGPPSGVKKKVAEIMNLTNAEFLDI